MYTILWVIEKDYYVYEEGDDVAVGDGDNEGDGLGETSGDGDSDGDGAGDGLVLAGVSACIASRTASRALCTRSRSAFKSRAI